MALHGLDRLEARAFHGHQLIADRQKPFGDDVEPCRRHQMVNVGDAAGHGIFNRDHAEIDVAVGYSAAKQSSKVGQGTGSWSG